MKLNCALSKLLLHEAKAPVYLFRSVPNTECLRIVVAHIISYFLLLHNDILETKVAFRFVLFSDFTQRREAVRYRVFGKTYRHHLQRTAGPLKLGPIDCPESSVIN